jgi:hypothetical protein
VGGGVTGPVNCDSIDTADKSEPEALAEFDRRAKKSASASGSWKRKSTFVGRVSIVAETQAGRVF